MSPEGKQRLVGVLVIAVFAALLVPFLFSGGVKKRHDLALTDDVTVGIEGTTIDVPTQPMEITPNEQSTNVSLEPLANNLPEEGVEQAMPVADVSAPVSGQSREDISTVLEGKNDGVTELTVIEEEKVAPKVVAPKPVKKAVVAKKKTEAKKVAAKPVVKKTVTSKTTQSELWSVQAGSFAEKSSVDRLVEKLQANGYRVYLQKISASSGPMVRVLVGREPTREKAQLVASRLKDDFGIVGNIVTGQR